MKKMLVLVALLVLVQTSFAFAQSSETPQQLTDVFNAVTKIESATATGDWGTAQQEVAEIRSLMQKMEPSVKQQVGEYTIKVIGGFVTQLDDALQAKNLAATEEPLSNLQKMKGWLTAQYVSGI